MTGRRPSSLMRETVGRTRALIAASHASIERSDDRVRDTLRLLVRSRGRLEPIALTIDVADPDGTMERWEAAMEQHQVDQETRRTEQAAR